MKLYTNHVTAKEKRLLYRLNESKGSLMSSANGPKFNIERALKESFDNASITAPVRSAAFLTLSAGQALLLRPFTDIARLAKSKEERETLQPLTGGRLTRESVEGIPKIFKGIGQLRTKPKEGVINIFEGGSNAVEFFLNIPIDIGLSVTRISKNSRKDISKTLAA